MRTDPKQKHMLPDRMTPMAAGAWGLGATCALWLGHRVSFVVGRRPSVSSVRLLASSLWAQAVGLRSLASQFLAVALEALSLWRWRCTFGFGPWDFLQRPVAFSCCFNPLLLALGAWAFAVGA